MQRLWQHLLFFPWRLRQVFAQPVLRAIEQAIAASEMRHNGQIRVAVEANLGLIPLLRGTTSRTRALEVFTQLRVWDTEQNNGVLIYLLLAEQRVEIVADRGINAKLDAAVWRGICQHMQDALRQGAYQVALCSGINEIDRHLSMHFPAIPGQANELPNRPVVL